MKNLRRKRFLLVFPFFYLLVFGFQNCSNDVHLVRSLAAQAMQFTQDIKAAMCSDSRVEPLDANNKFVFVVNMSSSNIGAWNTKSSSCSACYFWDASKASDVAAARLTAIQNFISAQNAQGSSAAYSVIGFSDTAGGVVYNGSSATGLNCDLTQVNNLGFVANPSGVINDLKAVQSAEQNSSWYRTLNITNGRYYQAVDASTQPPIMRGTNYVNALNCAQGVIMNDMNVYSTKNTNYKIFFLSDGAPDDGKTACGTVTNPVLKQQCYAQEIQQSTALLSTTTATAGNSLTIYGVFYSQNSQSVCPDPTNSTTCQTYYINQISGGTGVLQIIGSSFNSNTLLDLLNSKLSVSYKPDSFGFFNLNAINRKGQVLIDSSASGLPDVDKDTLCKQSNLAAGCLSMTDPRSVGKFNRASNALPILDGICVRLAGGILPTTTITSVQTACASAYAQIQCNPLIHNKIGYSDSSGWHGLNDCDIKIMGLDKIGTPLNYVDLHTNPQPAVDPCTNSLTAAQCTASNSDYNLGIDSDGDGLPDYMEILKGTDPTTVDSNVDTDGDGTTNAQEIQLGRDPFFPDSGTDPVNLNQFNINYQNPLCTKAATATLPAQNLDGQLLDIFRLQTTTLNAQSSITMQKVFVYYRLTPQNTARPVSEFYGMFLDVKQTIENNTLSLTPVNVYDGNGQPQPINGFTGNLNQFILMGKVTQ